MRVSPIALLIAALVAPATGLAVPSGGAAAQVTGVSRVLDTQLVAAAASLVEDPDGPGYWSADAEARWSFAAGVLNIGGRVSLAGRDLSLNPAGHHARATVTFLDTVTITVPGLPAGAPLDVTMTFAVHGTPSDPWGLRIGTAVPANWLAPRGGASAVLFASGVDGGFVSSGLHGDDFTFAPRLTVGNDQPFGITLQLYVELAGDWALASGLGYPALYGGYSTSGELDLLHTLTYAGIAVADAAGSPLDGGVMRSSDGTAYVATTPVPEPAAAALLLAGLVALHLRRRRR